MKKLESIASAENFQAVSVGKFDELNENLHEITPEKKIPGKVFIGSALGTTGSELSFQMFQPGTETGFLHTHKNHEELYLFLSGKGEFQVDGQIFPVAEGTIVRIAPSGKRSVRNNGDKSLVMLCIQYRSKTFDQTDAADAELMQEPVKWLLARMFLHMSNSCYSDKKFIALFSKKNKLKSYEQNM